MTDTLPPLPEPLCRDDTRHGQDYYTADQVRAYAAQAIAAAVAAERERCALIAETSHPNDWAYLGAAIRALPGTAHEGEA